MARLDLDRSRPHPRYLAQYGLGVMLMEAGRNVALNVLVGALAVLGKALAVVDVRVELERLEEIFSDDEDEDSASHREHSAGHRRGPTQGVALRFQL